MLRRTPIAGNSRNIGILRANIPVEVIGDEWHIMP
jgi:hypothetical protein